MEYKAYKHRKDILSFFEIALFRLFPSLSIIGAEELGAATFLSTYGYLFFLALPVIDIGRCMLYWNKEDGLDSTFKKNWNRAYYTLRMVVNLIASSLIVLAYDAGMSNLLVPGLGLFIGGVVGIPTLEYIIKTFGGLSGNINEHHPVDDKTENTRTFKNATISLTLLSVVLALTLLYFFPEITVSHEPLGWVMLIIANAIPVVGFALKYKDNSLQVASGLLMVGIALLFFAPELSSGLDHRMGTEVGVGLGFVLTGFLISLARLAYPLIVTEKKKDELTISHSTTPQPIPAPQPTALPQNEKTPYYLGYYDSKRSLFNVNSVVNTARSLLGRGK